MDSLTEAVLSFNALDLEHPQEEDDFYAAIHRLQDLLAVRAMRRLYPDGWPTYPE